MNAVTFTKTTNAENRLAWYPSNYSGLGIHRERWEVGGRFYYVVSDYSSGCGPEPVCDFDTLAEAKSYVTEEA